MSIQRTPFSPGFQQESRLLRKTAAGTTFLSNLFLSRLIEDFRRVIQTGCGRFFPSFPFALSPVIRFPSASTFIHQWVATHGTPAFLRWSKPSHSGLLRGGQKDRKRFFPPGSCAALCALCEDRVVRAASVGLADSARVASGAVEKQSRVPTPRPLPRVREPCGECRLSLVFFSVCALPLHVVDDDVDSLSRL